MGVRHIGVLIKAALLLNTCLLTPAGPSSLKVRNSAQAIESVLAYLQQKSAGVVPAISAQWKEKTLYSADKVQDFAVTGKLFAADDWLVEVYQGVAPLRRTVYEITVFNSKLRVYWKGQIKADGMVTELKEFSKLSMEESRQIEEDFSRKIRIPPPEPGGYGH